MFKKISLGLLLFLTIFIVIKVVATKTPQQIMKDALPSVVSISTDRMQGSGFFIQDCLIVTNLHVIKDANEIKISISSEGINLNIKEIVGIDEYNDIVILKSPYKKCSPLSLSIQNLEIGDDVYAIGSPRGLDATFSSGIISSIRDVDNIKIIQTTAPISPGNSGGPLLNNKSKVIGVVTASLTNSQNLNFAIPTSVILELLKDSREQLSGAKEHTQIAPMDDNTKNFKLPPKRNKDDYEVSNFIFNLMDSSRNDSLNSERFAATIFREHLTSLNDDNCQSHGKPPMFNEPNFTGCLPLTINGKSLSADSEEVTLVDHPAIVQIWSNTNESADIISISTRTIDTVDWKKSKGHLSTENLICISTTFLDFNSEKVNCESESAFLKSIRDYPLYSTEILNGICFNIIKAEQKKDIYLVEEMSGGSGGSGITSYFIFSKNIFDQWFNFSSNKIRSEVCSH